MVLFFVFVCAFTKNSERSVFKAHQYELAYEVHSNISALNDFQQFYNLRKPITFVDNLNLTFFKEHLKILVDNRTIHQELLSLQTKELLIKPVFLTRFYFLNHYPDTGEVPILS